MDGERSGEDATNEERMRSDRISQAPRLIFLQKKPPA